MISLLRDIFKLLIKCLCYSSNNKRLLKQMNDVKINNMLKLANSFLIIALIAVNNDN